MTTVRPTVQALNTGFAQDPDILRLHLNESPYGPVPGAVEAAAGQLGTAAAVYPDSDCTGVRERIARHFGVEPGQVAVGNGVEELLLMTALTFVERDGPVLVTETTFPGYLAAAALAGGVVRTVPLHDRGVCAETLTPAIRDGHPLTFVCNPLNPTGTVLGAADVARIIDAAEESGAVVVFDEAYMDFAGPAHEHALRAVRDGRRVIVMRSFSKAWGLAALRIGLALGPADLIARILRTRQALPFSVNRPAQYAAVAALDRPEFVAEVRHRTAAARTLLARRLDDMGVEHAPSVTNFMLVRTGGDSARIADRLVRDQRVLVRDLTGFGLPGCLRVTVGTEAQVERFCAALSAVLAGDPPRNEPGRAERSADNARAPIGLDAADPAAPAPTLTPVAPAALFNGYLGANVVYALNELELWDRLAERPQSIEELAKAAGADQHKLLTLLRAAAVLGYVDLSGERVELTPAGQDLEPQAGYFTWAVGGYGPLLRALAPIATAEVAFDREVRRDEARVAAGVGRVGRMIMRPVQERVLAGIDFSTVADLGCGDGSRLIQLCRADPARRGIGVDISRPACELATRRVADAGLSARVDILCADAFDVATGPKLSDVDMVTCFFMLHDLFAEHGAAATMRKLRAALPAARHLLIADSMAYDWAGHRGDLPIFAAGFELVHAFMDTPIAGLDVYEDAFAAAGLTIEARVPFGVPSTWLYHLTVR